MRPSRLPLLIIAALGLATFTVWGQGEGAAPERAPGSDPLVAPVARATLVPIELLDDAEWTFEAARHLLMRAGFGGSHEEVKALHALGLEDAVDYLVDGGGQSRTPGFAADFPLRPDYRALREATREERMKANADFRRASDLVMRDLRRWWLQRMVETKRPLEEKMTLFWHGHFTSGYRDVRNALHMAQQNDLLRDHALGSFELLVHAVAKDAAMLEYLDNNRNRRERPNENFAREVLELFTLGVGHYSERDIVEAARAFTGWTFNADTGAYVFQANQHDYGVKEFMGRRGRFDGEDIIDIVLERPRVAEYIVQRVLDFFCGAPNDERPGASLIPAQDADALTALFRGDFGPADRYEMKPLLRFLFRSRAFYAPTIRGQRVKSPVELVVGAVRQLELPAARTVALMDTTAAQQGQMLFQPPNVKGWPGHRDWISTSSLYDRYNFAGLITRDLDARSFGRKPAPKAKAGRKPTPKSKPSREGSVTTGSPAGSQPASRPASQLSSQPASRPASRPSSRPTSRPSSQGNAPSAAPKSGPPTPKKKPAPRRPASPAERMARLRFPFDPVGLCRRHGMAKAEEIVDHFAQTCLAVPLSRDARAELVAVLHDAKAKNSRPFALDRKDAGRRLRSMLHLLFASPEYQLN
jgi:uncharacterized protein (DUF1800 family)